MLLLPALLPLLLTGPFFISHDGDFHLHRLAALDRAVRAGAWYPRWFPEFAFGYGQPVLNFYGPLSYYWGLPFTLLGLDVTLTMKLILAMGLIASAWSLYLFARLYLDRGPALVAAVLYAVLPYHLIDLYIRGAVAEFLAFVWFPLILWAFHRLIVRQRQPLYPALAALSLTALIVTHSLSALIFAPVLIGYLLLLLWRKWEFPLWGMVALTLAAAMVLSAFYWLPVLTESGYVGLGSGASQGYQNHLLSPGDLLAWDPAYDYTVETPSVFRLGWVQTGLLVAALILSWRVRRLWPFSAFWLLVAAASILMLTTASLPLWHLFEKGLAFLQYPWRFQSLTVLSTALLGGVVLQAIGRREGWRQPVGGAAILAVATAWAIWSLPVVPSAPDLSVAGMWHQDRELNQIGTTWTGEYVPVWVREQRWAISHPPAEAEAPSGAGAVTLPSLTGGALSLVGVGYTAYAMEIDAPQGADLILHQFYFPGWQAKWQGRIVPARAVGDLGLASFSLPPGTGPLTLHLALTPPRWGGMLLSSVAALMTGVALGVYAWRSRGGGQGTAASALGVAVLHLVPAAVLLAGILWPNGRMQRVHEVNANLDNLVVLQSFEVGAARYHPGDVVNVTLYWLALDRLRGEYKVFVHLTDAATTRQPAQHDGDPGGGFTPVARWLPGEVVADPHALVLPADLPPGDYRLWAGMYEYPTMHNLSIVAADAPTDGRRVLLGEIEVVAP